MPTPLLLQPISFRSVTARNRIVVAPMCQYSAADGLGDDWHVQHLGARAMGGAGIVFTEATHVSAIGRITHHCLGLWSARHQALLTRLAAIIARGGTVPGIQLAHAGRKASTTRTWEGSKPIGRTMAAGCLSRPARSRVAAAGGQRAGREAELPPPYWRATLA
jgi:2,4-dienoyl-CoA reductase-like NADH-dependent reductase (Old Yellow Enzyme family)